MRRIEDAAFHGGATAARECRGRELVDRLGHLVGRIETLFAGDETRTAEWAAVRTGLPSTRRSLVPIARALLVGDRVRVPFDKQHIMRAPHGDEARLHRHYGLEPASSRPSPDGAMTRSEEEVRVDTARRVHGRVRVRKYVVTEEMQYSIPVRREEIRVENLPATGEDVDADVTGPEVSTGEHEIILHEEVPVIAKRVVPTERVRVLKETRTAEAEVIRDVRKERIEVDDDLSR